MKVNCNWGIKNYLTRNNIIMATVTLQFQTPQQFSQFRNSVPDCTTHSDIANLIITYTCNEAEVARAILTLGATVIERHPVS
jgi:hypothetical protein